MVKEAEAVYSHQVKDGRRNVGAMSLTLDKPA